MAVIGLMAAVNLVAFIALRDAASGLNNDAAPDAALAKTLQFQTADMNGAQNRYVLDRGASRPAYLGARHRFLASLASARRTLTQPAQQQRLSRIGALFARYDAVDRRIAAAVASGRDATARSLAAGAATSTYLQMAELAHEVPRTSEIDRVQASNEYNRRQTIALVCLLVLDVAAIVMVASLLAERRRASRALDRRSAEYRALVSQIPAAAITYDTRTGELLSANPQHHDLYRYAQDGNYTIPVWLTSIAADDRDEAVGSYRAAVDDGSDWEHTYRYRRPDGTVIWVRDFDTAVPGEPHVRQAVAFDVTEQQNLQAERERLVHQLPAALVRFEPATGRLDYASAQITLLTGIAPLDWPEDAFGYFVSRVRAQPSGPPLSAEVPSAEAVARGAAEPFSGLYQWERPDGGLI